MYYEDEELMDIIKEDLLKEIFSPCDRYIVEGYYVSAEPFKKLAENTLAVTEFIYEKYHVMNDQIFTHIEQAVKEIHDLETDEETEMDLMEWILETVDYELADRVNLEDIGMCLADFG